MTTVNSDHRLLRRCLTVRELIDELSGFAEDAKVVFGSDYGDYHHTEQALPVVDVSPLDDTEVLTENQGYSRSGIAISAGRDDELDDNGEPVGPTPRPDASNIVVLRMSSNR